MVRGCVLINEQISWLKVLVWCIPVIFGAGGIYASVVHSKDAVAEVKADVKQLEVSQATHRSTVGHAVTESRLSQIEENQKSILVRQQQVGENVSAICQATGAKCQ